MYKIYLKQSYLQHEIQYKTDWNVLTELMLLTRRQFWFISS